MLLLVKHVCRYADAVICGSAVERQLGAQYRVDGRPVCLWPAVPSRALFTVKCPSSGESAYTVDSHLSVTLPEARTSPIHTACTASLQASQHAPCITHLRTVADDS